MITITYGMTGKEVREAVNANITELETYYLAEADISGVAAGLSVDNFMAGMNTQLASLSTKIALLTTEYTEYTAATADIASVINANFTEMSDQGDIFLADGYDWFLSIKQATIPGKGVANILAQQDSWKLAYYGNEDILYLSADNGLTWPYSIAFPGECDKIRTAHVYKDGSVFIAIKENLIYSSQDLLATLPEVTCMDTDGVTPMPLHEPVNVLYPGAYFATFRGNSFVKDGVEVFIFGTYPHHNDYGAAPINIYRVINGGADMRAIYHFGQNTAGDMKDDGTSTGGVGGNLLGDVGNETVCKHFHYCNYNYGKDELWIQTGDGGGVSPTIWFIKAVYTVATDSFVFTEYDMNQFSSYFRSCSLDFYNNGDSCIWASDGNGNVYKVSYAQLTTTLANHTVKYDGIRNILGLSTYAEKMFFIGGPETPGTLGVSLDYGETWEEAPDNYMGIIGALTAKFLSRLWNEDSDGYSLVHRSIVVPLYAKESYLIKIKDKPVH
jgi:hypothetical protein